MNAQNRLVNLGNEIPRKKSHNKFKEIFENQN